MPLISGCVIIDPNRRTKACAAVGAARNHHVGAVAVARWSHTGQHVDIVISGAAGTIDCQEYLPCQPSRIDIAARQAATEVHCGSLVKRWCLVPNLRIGRANAPETASAVSAANEKVPVGGNVECSPMRRVGKVKWTLPGDAGIG